MTEIQNNEIGWQPNPGRQTFVLQREEFEILYGGARGGGKTEAGLAWLTRWVHKPNFRALVIRKNAEDLKNWIDRASQMYGMLGGFAVGKPTQFRFPSGAIIYTGHFKDATAYTKYQGQEFQKMVIEELTHIPLEESYEKLIASCRSTDPELIPQVFCSTNPGEVGHLWVKRRFVDITEPMTTYFYDIDGITLSRIYIPATVDDNPVLIKKDPTYVARLEAIRDEATRKRWRSGSWDDYEIKGAYYSNQMNQASREGRITTITYNPAFAVDTFWDLGVGDSTAIIFAQKIGEKLHVIDYAESNGEGLPYYAELIKNKGYKYGTHYAPHDINVTELGTGKTRIETAYDLGIRFSIVPRLSLDDGIQASREILAYCYFDEINTEALINSLKNYRKQWDEKRQIYSDQPVHDWSSHASDAFRYMAISTQKEIVKERKLKPEEIIAQVQSSQYIAKMAFTNNQNDSDYESSYQDIEFY